MEATTEETQLRNLIALAMGKAAKLLEDGDAEGLERALDVVMKQVGVVVGEKFRGDGEAHEEGIRVGMEMAVNKLWKLRLEMRTEMAAAIAAVSTKAQEHFKEEHWRRGCER